MIQRYQDSKKYRKLSPGTLKYYKRYLRDIEALGVTLPFTSFTRRAVIDFIETYPKPHQRRQVAAVLKNLFGAARYYGVVTTDETTELDLETDRPRDRVWSDAEIARWIETGAGEDPHMITAFLLLQFTAQRPVRRPKDGLAAIFGHGHIEMITQHGVDGNIKESPCLPTLVGDDR